MTFPPEVNRVLNRDTFMTSVFGLHGGARYEHGLAPAVYRAHPGGVWSPMTGVRRDAERLNTNFWLARFHERIGNTDVAAHFDRRYLRDLVRRTPAKSLFSALLARLRGLLR